MHKIVLPLLFFYQDSFGIERPKSWFVIKQRNQSKIKSITFIFNDCKLRRQIFKLTPQEIWDFFSKKCLKDHFQTFLFLNVLLLMKCSCNQNKWKSCQFGRCERTFFSNDFIFFFCVCFVGCALALFYWRIIPFLLSKASFSESICW